MVVVETEEMFKARKEAEANHKALRPPLVVSHSIPATGSSNMSQSISEDGNKKCGYQWVLCTLDTCVCLLSFCQIHLFGYFLCVSMFGMRLLSTYMFQKRSDLSDPTASFYTTNHSPVLAVIRLLQNISCNSRTETDQLRIKEQLLDCQGKYHFPPFLSMAKKTPIAEHIVITQRDQAGSKPVRLVVYLCVCGRIVVLSFSLRQQIIVP